MRKIIRGFLLIVICMSLSACGSKSVNSKESSNKTKTEKLQVSEKTQTVDKPQVTKTEKDKFKVDWQKCIDDTKKELISNNNYLKDVHIEVEDKQITFAAVVSDSTSKETALSLADTMIRRFNVNAKLQDNSIKESTKNYLGGLYDQYSIMIGVSQLSKTKNVKDSYIYDVIGKGVHRAPKLQ